MKITEAIDKLNTLLEQCGDIEVWREADAGIIEVTSVTAEHYIVPDNIVAIIA